MIVVLAVAGAQEPAAPAETPRAPGEEIVVYGDLAIERARDAIVHELERLGYHVRRRARGQTVFGPPSPWMGGAVLEADGTLSFRSPLVVTGIPDETWALDPRYEDPTEPRPEVGIGAGVALPSRSKRDAVRARVIAETRDEVEAFLAVVQRTAFEVTVNDLPDRLDTLWVSGIPLEGSVPLETPEARRRAVLEHWATRADTPEGIRVTVLVEAWLAQTVEPSATPITEAERTEFEVLRQDDRSLPR